jgi:hypothetical protein
MPEKSSPTVKSYSVHEDQLKWFDVPLVKGGKAAVLHGDPTKAGTVVLRFKFPPNRQTPPHRHPYDEFTTILSGKVYYGEGETFDASKPEIGRLVHSPSCLRVKLILSGPWTKKQSCNCNSKAHLKRFMSMLRTISSANSAPDHVALLALSDIARLPN